LFENIREDFQTHGASFKNRAFWAMLTYRFGRWGESRSSSPARWLCGKVYGALYLISEITTGVHIPCGVTLGKRFHIIHADGSISIHPATIIGDDVGVMHNVTIGTNMNDEVPVIGNKVFIGVGASVLGGVKIGDGARIAANSLVISDVPAGAVAMGVPARVLRDFSTANLTASGRSPGTH
jgi:serine O-acetyltransferase